jgi:hypothetical protein
MKYRYLKHTQSERKGAIVDMQNDPVRIKQLLERGIIEPVKPPAEKREKKIVEPEETKKPRARRKKVKADEPVSEPQGGEV